MNSEKQSKLAFLDMFGLQPRLYINNQSTYKTKFGSFLTLILFGCVILLSWNYVKDMYYKQNPKITMTQGQTSHPEKFIMNKKSFTFTMVMEDPMYNIYSDPQVFTIRAKQEITKKFNNSFVHDSYDIPVRKCQSEDFHQQKDWFLDQANFEDLYCFDVTNNEPYIEGDYGSDVFARIDIMFEKCSNETSPVQCKPENEIEEILSGNYFGVFLTDQILDLKDYEQPFKTVGKNLFGMVSTSMYKQVEYYFRNTYMEDSDHILSSRVTTRRGMSFEEEKTFTSNISETRNNRQFLKIVLRNEKVKYSKIYRDYLGVTDVLISVGGILKTLTLLFYIIYHIVSRKLFNLNMINQLFTFENEKIDDSTKMTYSKNELKAKEKKQLFFKSLCSLLNCKVCDERDNEKDYNMMNFAVKKMSYHLNITNIVNKLMEFEKLKLLLLNENQLNLFNYIPKPKINDSLIDQDKKMKENNKNNKNQINMMRQINNQNKNYFLLQDNLNEKQKYNDALQSFKEIKDQASKSQIDKKLMDFMDSPKFYEDLDRIENQALQKIEQPSLQPKQYFQNYFCKDIDSISSNSEQCSGTFSNRELLSPPNGLDIQLADQKQMIRNQRNRRNNNSNKRKSFENLVVQGISQSNNIQVKENSNNITFGEYTYQKSSDSQNFNNSYKVEESTDDFGGPRSSASIPDNEADTQRIKTKNIKDLTDQRVY